LVYIIIIIIIMVVRSLFPATSSLQQTAIPNA